MPITIDAPRSAFRGPLRRAALLLLLETGGHKRLICNDRAAIRRITELTTAIRAVMR